MRIGVFLSVFLLALSARCQYVAVEKPSEPEAHPVSRPEPRHRVTSSPLKIFTDLSSALPEARRSACRQLGLGDSPESPEVDDVRLRMLNLDADDDLEAILVVTVGKRLTRAVVFDKAKDGWWQVGAFDYSWIWTSDTAEHLIEVKEIVWPGRKELIVRQESGGTGVVRTDLAIYRMYSGELYRVFDVNESWQYAAMGQPNVTAYLEQHEISFHDQYAAYHQGRPSILVRHTKTAYPTDSSAQPSVQNLGCVAYAWDARRFEFLSDSAATARLCGPETGLKPPESSNRPAN